MHANNLPENKGLIGASTFAQMKPTAYFINTSRGRMVGRRCALHRSDQGRHRGCGLDVHYEEPRPRSDRLIGLHNVHSDAASCGRLAQSHPERDRNDPEQRPRRSGQSADQISNHLAYRRVGDALPMQFPMLHDTLPEPWLLGQDQMVAVEMDETDLIAADAAGIG